MQLKRSGDNRWDILENMVIIGCVEKSHDHVRVDTYKRLIINRKRNDIKELANLVDLEKLEVSF